MKPGDPVIRRNAPAVISGDRDVTLRDLFAAFCAAGIISNQALREDLIRNVPTNEEKSVAHYAYGYADALLAEREVEHDG